MKLDTFMSAMDDFSLQDLCKNYLSGKVELQAFELTVAYNGTFS